MTLFDDLYSSFGTNSFDSSHIVTTVTSQGFEVFDVSRPHTKDVLHPIQVHKLNLLGAVEKNNLHPVVDQLQEVFVTSQNKDFLVCW